MPTDDKRIVRVTLWGTIANLFLMAIKAVAGIASGSMSLVADAVHSASDLGTDAITILGVKLGGRDADENHPYGHGKLETFAAIGVAVALVLVGAGIATTAGRELFLGNESFPGPTVLIVAALSVAIKEGLYWVTRSVARSTGSPVLSANAWHHRSDAFSSVAVLCGGVGGLLGWGQADSAAGLVVGLMVVGVGLQMLIESAKELSEYAVDEQTRLCLIDALEENEQVHSWHHLRTRRSGRTVFVDCHVLVDPGLSVAEGHRIAGVVRGSLARECPYPADILIHIEPDLPEFRRSKPSTGSPII